MSARSRSRLVDAFSNWFQSDAGVLQSFALSTGGAVAELIWPHMDPSHYWYLFVCTYWSAFTCNALANSSRRDAEDVRGLLKAIKDEEDQILGKEH